MTRRAATALFAIILGVLTVAPAWARAAWSSPFNLAAPGTLDRLPAQLAQAPSGAAAAGFSVIDVDTPGSAQAYLTQRTPGGSVGAPRAISGAGEILALAYSPRGLELLTGISPAHLDCCSSVNAGRVTRAGVTQTQTLVSGLAGASLARLVTLGGGRQLAAMASERGVWVAQSRAGGSFAATHRLTGAADAPQALSAAALDGENSIVAWAAAGPAGFADPSAIFYALGSRRGSPRRAQTLLRAAPGHGIDELAVAGRGSRATAAWIDVAYDRRGAYHAQVSAADVAPRPGVRTFAIAGSGIAGLSLVADAGGDQALAFKACHSDGSCSVRVATRGRTASFTRAGSLGAIDASQTPSASIAPNGRVIVGWSRNGHPVAAVGSARSGSFGAVRTLSPTVYAYDIAVTAGSGGGFAAWTQGTLNPSLVAATYR